jgi:hypothetical protein
MSPAIPARARLPGKDRDLDDINLHYALANLPEPGIYMLLGVGILLCGQRFLRRKSA